MTHVLRAKSAEQESQKLRATSTSSTLYVTSQNSHFCRQMSHAFEVHTNNSKVKYTYSKVKCLSLEMEHTAFSNAMGIQMLTKPRNNV